MDFIEQVIVQLIEHNYKLIPCTFCSPLGTGVLLDQNGKKYYCWHHIILSLLTTCFPTAGLSATHVCASWLELGSQVDHLVNAAYPSYQRSKHDEGSAGWSSSEQWIGNRICYILLRKLSLRHVNKKESRRSWPLPRRKAMPDIFLDSKSRPSEWKSNTLPLELKTPFWAKLD